ncbi:MAG TPA: nucleoside-diphosphate sugar epimerase/dehydratase [Gammaproteobacteria bacterium]|nr:nucleoside-diphosphate sugar epimerase/dehydratase [Gammaproteobacteria bacterium]
MLISHRYKDLFWRHKIVNFINIRYFFSKFLYAFVKTSFAAKIKSHGRVIASSYDFCAVFAAWLLACWVLIDLISTILIISRSTLFSLYWKPIIFSLSWILPLQLILFRLSGLYRGFWRFASIQDLRKILAVAIIGGLMVNVLLWILKAWILSDAIFILHFKLLPPYIVSLLYILFLVALLSSARLFVRFVKNYRHLYEDCLRVIIIGAGNAGEGLVRDLLRDESHRYNPIAFVDDDLHKQGREIHNVRVLGTIKELPRLILKHNVDLVLIAIPSASSSNMRSVVDICEQAKTPCYTLPGIKDLANGYVSINILRSILLEDLLGRYPVTCQLESIKPSLKHKTILITGGGGSIGSELCRQTALLEDSSRLVIVDSNEYNLYSIDMELRQRFPTYQFYSILLNVTDRVGIQTVLKKYQPHLLFHVAAYKHVPLLEDQVRVAIYNNIIGTSIVAEEAMRAGVETFVLISSDKAVHPTNIMGATKRATEYFCQNLNYHSIKTKFITVRFGNVLNSAGSVVPLFKKQIEAGGPVTVTHPEITRFFMTISEASQLILQAAFLGQGGEIFVLDMGEPIKIRYLAEQMIKMAGKKIDQDIKIVYTGLRPGEKLYEEYFYTNETLQTTEYSKILRAQSQHRDFSEIQAMCQQFEKICKAVNIEQSEFIRLLKEFVPEYQIKDVDKNFDDALVVAC